LQFYTVETLYNFQFLYYFADKPLLNSLLCPWFTNWLEVRYFAVDILPLLQLIVRAEYRSGVILIINYAPLLYKVCLVSY